MKISNKNIGYSYKPFVIAEVAQAHDGSLGTAFKFIDEANRCGVDAIKFQTHIANEESTPDEPWRIPFSSQDASRFNYWKRMEFKKEEWALLKNYAESLGLIFLSSPFSILACQWLDEINIEAWKVASGEVHNEELINWICKTGKPIILSSGLSLPEETKKVVDKIKQLSIPHALLHCTTKYPTPSGEVGINILSDYIKDYPEIPIGLSDHSSSIFPSIISAYLGASIFEVHLKLYDDMFGPDSSSSLLPEKLSELVKGINFAFEMRNNPVNKKFQLKELTNEKSIFGRSLYINNPVNKGDIIKIEDIGYKKPGGGLSYESINSLLNSYAKYDLPKNHMLRLTDVKK